MTTILKEQLESAAGLFEQMNEHKVPADPAVFAMFGIMLGTLKALQRSDEQNALDAAQVGRAELSEAQLQNIETQCLGRTLINGEMIRLLISAVRAARKERDEYGAEIRRMCGTMTLEEIHTEAHHIAELDRIDQIATDRTDTEIADWVSDELDIGKNAYTEKIRIVEGIRNRTWKGTP